MSYYLEFMYIIILIIICKTCEDLLLGKFKKKVFFFNILFLP